jgi:hypothetical protein
LFVGDFATQILEELFERLFFISLDQTIHQFQGRDGAGKVIVQVDCEVFAHLPIALTFESREQQRLTCVPAAGRRRDR